MEYMRDGLKGSDRCNACLGKGWVYPNLDELCQLCGATGRVEWKAYPVPGPWRSEQEHGIEWLTKKPGAA